jgi:hypothetical protein
VYGTEIVMDGTALDEHALRRAHQIIQHQSQPAGKALGNELSETMH